VFDLRWLPGDVRLSDGGQLSYWSSAQSGTEDLFDDPDALLASDLVAMTGKKKIHYYLASVGMDSIIKFWDYEEDLLKEKKTSRALTLNQKEPQVASVKVADNRYAQYTVEPPITRSPDNVASVNEYIENS
jgi:hypothetical protein